MRARMLVAAALGAVLALGAACAPAAAATAPIEFSRDGSTWASTLPGSLFGDYRLVPRDAVTRSFLLRNNAPEAGYLRITMRDVTTDNLDYAGALSVRADLVGWPGEAVAISAARPCVRLSEGPVVPSGGSARVDLTALLGDLDGQRGQNGSTAFQVVVSLSGQPLGLGATGCPTSGAEMAGFSPFGGGATVVRGSSIRYASTSAGWTPTAWMPATTVDDGPATDLPTTAVPPTPALRVASNTDRFYQEYDVALWLAAALLGAAAARLVLRRRPQAEPETGHDTNGAPR